MASFVGLVLAAGHGKAANHAGAVASLGVKGRARCNGHDVQHPNTGICRGFHPALIALFGV
jgi:hypothetical protein